MPTKLKTASAGKPSFVSRAVIKEFFDKNSTVVMGVRVTMRDVMEYFECSRMEAAGKVADDRDVLVDVADYKALA